jgi:hypothetical protein
LKKLQAKKEDEIAASGGNEEGSGDTLLTPSEEAEAKNYNPTADVNYIFSKIAGWNYNFIDNGFGRARSHIFNPFSFT